MLLSDFLRLLVAYLGIWLLHLALAGLLSLPILFLIWRKRLPWQAWELLIFVIPFWTWILWRSLPVEHRNKSIVNYEAEGAALSVFVALAVLIAAFNRSDRQRTTVSLVLIILTTIAAASLSLFVPWLGPQDWRSSIPSAPR
jgi:hypothetical protein